MLQIQTFDARAGGNVLYKALAHPLAAEAFARLYKGLHGRLVLYDPENIAEAMLAMYPGLPGLEAIYVQNVMEIGRERAGYIARPLTELPESSADTVLIAAFDAAGIQAQITHLLPAGAKVLTLDEARLPDAMLTNPKKYLDRLNFATNLVFFREEAGLSTRLVTANYWSNYGANSVRFWMRLFDAAGQPLATWEQALPQGPAGIAIDSREIRGEFDLPPFTGQLCLHAIGVAGHDVVKYALDTFSNDNGASLSCTHDANAWPSDRYAGLPAPDHDERVVLWVQNSHAVAIPAGTLQLDRMGAENPVAYAHDIGPFATVAVDVAELLPEARWPAQIELRAGRHMVRPRYEITRAERTRIAHINVERSDLRPDPNIPTLPAAMGRGYLLPFPVLDPSQFRTIVQPNPMAESQSSLPLRLDIFDEAGKLLEARFLGNLPRNHNVALDFDTVGNARRGHAELVYDFRDSGSADGWMHTLVRFEHRATGHTAETSFGAHIFNTAMVYKDEPQSYSGPPPGLSTRLFLKLGQGRRRSFSVLIYPASAVWHPRSGTDLELHGSDGVLLTKHRITIACSGSVMIRPDEIFAPEMIAAAGPVGYILIRDTTCRLFGYHGLMDDAGGFSLDHMFGF